MGIIIGPESERITIVGVTSRHMWGDGFYLAGGEDIALCSVVAEHNRRQGLSIIRGNRILVTDSTFRDTRGTAPSAGIDLEPNKPHERITNVRIENSKFINNAGGGVMISGKKAEVAHVEILHNLFEGPRPILVENAPRVRSTSICENRYVRKGRSGQSRLQCLRRQGRGRLVAVGLPRGIRHAVREAPSNQEEQAASRQLTSRQLTRTLMPAAL
jgi:hypothetical protein